MQCLKIVLLSLLTLGCSPPDQIISPTEKNPSNAAWTHGAIATAANPHAVAAAIEILERGGHAVDAAIAAHAVLGLVEPQSSGIGGGAFMLVYEDDKKELVFHDGREVAPAGATIDMFMLESSVMSFFDAWQSGKAIGVPGTIALYKAAHQEHGLIPWSNLFQPAIRLAIHGFKVSPRLANYLPMMAQQSLLDENPGTADYFYPNGEALQTGDLLRNPEYASTLTRIAQEGISAFYEGRIAEQIVEAAQADPNPGKLTIHDLASYRTVRRPVICGPFRKMKICTTSPPSSGSVQIMIAAIYDHLLPTTSTHVDKITAFVDAQRLAYADRDHYFGDPDEIDIPLENLLDPQYLKYRATERFDPDEAATPGDPGLVLKGDDIASLFSKDTTEEATGTTHLSIIDGEGNAVSMTATIEAPFGTQRWAAGFLLNNEMTDFARTIDASGKNPANAIVPGRRPRSSMSPTMVFDAEGNILMVTGSPGGNSIPAYVAKTIIGVLDWNLSVQAAVDYPNIVARGDTVRVEISAEPGETIANNLKARGYNVEESDEENSGLHVIAVNANGLEGAADKRREGIVKKIIHR